MKKRTHILIADDDAIMREMLEAVLCDDFDVSIASDGKEALQIANELDIDAILLDVDMPGPNGYETCSILKEAPRTAGIPIIFLSARSSIEERLKGYAVGGNDYLIKPYQADELKAKITLIQFHAKTAKALSGQVNEVMDAAMASANMVGEVGVLLTFMKVANTCHDYQSVADALFQALKCYGFEGCLRMFGHHGVINTTGPTACSALEDSILSHVQNSGVTGLQTLGSNTVFSYGNAMLLVRNLLPENHPSHTDKEEAERHGRARDNIALLVEGACARIKAIDAESKLVGAGKSIKLVDLTKDALLDLNAEQRIHREKISHLLQDMVVEVERLLASLALTASQEDQVIDTVRRGVGDVMAVFDQGDKIEMRLDSVIQQLRSAA